MGVCALGKLLGQSLTIHRQVLGSPGARQLDHGLKTGEILKNLPPISLRAVHTRSFAEGSPQPESLLVTTPFCSSSISAPGSWFENDDVRQRLYLLWDDMRGCGDP